MFAQDEGREARGVGTAGAAPPSGEQPCSMPNRQSDWYPGPEVGVLTICETEWNGAAVMALEREGPDGLPPKAGVVADVGTPANMRRRTAATARTPIPPKGRRRCGPPDGIAGGLSVLIGFPREKRAGRDEVRFRRNDGPSKAPAQGPTGSIRFRRPGEARGSARPRWRPQRSARGPLARSRGVRGGKPILAHDPSFIVPRRAGAIHGA